MCHEVQRCNLPPYTFPQLSIVQFGPKKSPFSFTLVCFWQKNAFVTYCSAATYRLIHFRSCQMGHGPCPAVTLHPTSYCTVTLFVLCHSNEVLLCHKCTIPVQMRSQRTAVPLLVCQLLQAWKRVRPSKLFLRNSLQYISTRSCHTAGNDTSGAD